jgi:hypothetical protein
MMSSTTRLTATSLLGGALLSIAVPASASFQRGTRPHCSLAFNKPAVGAL